MEQYSVDEAFVDFSGIPDVHSVARQLVQRIKQCTGIPVSIGMAPNKTLAKIASRFAKKMIQVIRVVASSIATRSA